MRYVALYCRVSSEDQKERETIENQIDILKTYVELKEETIIYDIYLDDGVTGAISLENRPDGARLLKDASSGFFDTVIVYKVDRFGRDTLTGLQAAEMIIKCGVSIISVTEPFDLNTPTGRFQFITYLNMAELDRNNILDRMFLGATRAAKKGKWLGGIVPYGYEVNNDGYLEINESEADIVKKIYNLYVNGDMSSLAIAVHLNNLGIPSSCGTGKGKRTKRITGKWRSNSIQRILSSTTYKGIRLYGKRSKRRKEPIEIDTPVIISEEFWDKAQEVKKKNAIISKRNNNKHEYLLRGLITCKECKKKFYGISYKDKSAVYCCAGKRGDNKRVFGVKCNSVNINADFIEELIWNDCLYICKHFNEHVQMIKDKEPDKSNDIQEELEKSNKILTNIKVEKDNILRLFRKNIITESELESQLKDIKKEETNILNLINIISIKLDAYKHEDELINIMRDKLSYYNQRLDGADFELKRDIAELLVQSIEITTCYDGGHKTPGIHATYNIVKLDNYTDMGLKLQ